VRTVLDDLDGFRSAQQIHAELGRRDDSVGLSTVYRALASMATDGEIDSLLTDDGETVYRRCEGGTHHHHLVCRQCGATVEIDGPAVETWADRMAAEHGYDDVSHTLEIFGRCAACRA
jgi:Fur family ferric uptake transcriptional regulator